jgi:cold shock protein
VRAFVIATVDQQPGGTVGRPRFAKSNFFAGAASPLEAQRGCRRQPLLVAVSREIDANVGKPTGSPSAGSNRGFPCGVLNYLFRMRLLFQMESDDVATGTVKWFNPTKSYGFIQPDGGGKDIFVHTSAVEKAGFTGLAEGAKISYEIISDRGKESGGNLRI